jgi:hypothetical protein
MNTQETPAMTNTNSDQEQTSESEYEFSPAELKRLAIYRAAMRQGFYNDGAPTQSRTGRDSARLNTVDSILA